MNVSSIVSGASKAPLNSIVKQELLRALVFSSNSISNANFIMQTERIFSQTTSTSHNFSKPILKTQSTLYIYYAWYPVKSPLQNAPGEKKPFVETHPIKSHQSKRLIAQMYLFDKIQPPNNKPLKPICPPDRFAHKSKKILVVFSFLQKISF